MFVIGKSFRHTSPSELQRCKLGRFFEFLHKMSEIIEPAFQGNPGLKNIMVGLGWDVNAFDTGADFDLDAAAFMLGSNGKCPTDKEFVFYGNLEHPSGAVKHMGDNRTGDGEGDDEEMEIALADVPANVERIAFTVTIYEAEARRQNFGQVSNAYIRIVDKDTNQELIHYDLGEDFSIETAIVVGELYKHNGEW